MSDIGTVKLDNDFEGSFKNYFVILYFWKQTNHHKDIYAITRLGYK